MSSNSGWIESVTWELPAHKGRIKFSIDILWNLQIQLTFQTWEFFVTLFSGTVRPRRLKLGTHMGSGQMYHVYWNQAAAAYSSLYFFIFLSLQFSTLKFFVTLFLGTVRPRRLKLGTHVESGQMYMYIGIRLLLLICPFISSFFFLSNFQHWKFWSHFSQELWGLEGCCFLFIPLFLHFSFSPIFNIEIFHHSFLRNCEA